MTAVTQYRWYEPLSEEYCVKLKVKDFPQDGPAVIIAYQGTQNEERAVRPNAGDLMRVIEKRLGNEPLVMSKFDNEWNIRSGNAGGKDENLIVALAKFYLDLKPFTP